MKTSTFAFILFNFFTTIAFGATSGHIIEGKVTNLAVDWVSIETSPGNTVQVSRAFVEKRLGHSAKTGENVSLTVQKSDFKKK